MRVTDLLRGRRSAPAPPGYGGGVGDDREPEDGILEHDGAEYYCRTVRSPDGEWRADYGRRQGGEESRLIVRQGGTLRWSAPLERPGLADVADDGTVAIAEQGAAGSTGGRALVFDPDGREAVSRSFESNVADCEVAPDGSYVAVTTLPPDATVYLFDVGAGREVGSQGIDRTNVSVSGFTQNGRDWLLYLRLDGRADPYFALAMDGTVAWSSDRYRATESLSSRLKNWFRTTDQPGR